MTSRVHFYAGAGGCICCGATGAPDGEWCPKRTQIEATWCNATGQPYSPVHHLRGEAGRRGARVVEDQVQRGPTSLARFRVVRGEEVLAEAEHVVGETAARMCLTKIGPPKGPG